MQQNLDLSVVIVNWNAREVTATCIESIVNHLVGLQYEILLVDNGSLDGSVEQFAGNERVRLITNSSNLGFAKANNIGMRNAAGEVFLLLNNDTLILDDSIQKTYNFLKRRPSVGMVGCMLLNRDRTLQRSCSRFPRVLTSLFGRQIFAQVLKRLFPSLEPTLISAYSDEDHLRELRPDWIMGAFMMVKREVVEASGMLDEDYYMYEEDMDWCYRIWRSGWRISYSPDSAIIHLGGESSRKVPEATMRRKLAGFFLFFRKHFPEKLQAAIAVQYASFIVELALRSAVYLFAGSRNRDECGNLLSKLRFFPDEMTSVKRKQLTEPPCLSSGIPKR